MKDIDYVAIGKRMKTARKNLNFTQEELAEMVDVVPSYISEIERGTSICSLAVIVKIADVLKLNLDNFIRGINISNADSTFKELLNNIPEDKHELFISICTNIAKSFNEK